MVLDVYVGLCVSCFFLSVLFVVVLLLFQVFFWNDFIDTRVCEEKKNSKSISSERHEKSTDCWPRVRIEHLFAIKFPAWSSSNVQKRHEKWQQKISCLHPNVCSVCNLYGYKYILNTFAVDVCYSFCGSRVHIHQKSHADEDLEKLRSRKQTKQK